MNHIGRIVQVIGPIVDVKFDPDEIPEIRNAIEITLDENGSNRKIICEVSMQIEGGIVRCVAMSPTEGLSRGLPARDTENPIRVPVGRETLGRLFNALGETIDNGPS
ncbi:MAG TPA: F0F1 ATP synthase subunit beta, partial [Spirochaetia bacterium]|nr:F0F1 ATP synthase subunit beta [Spirochaetia bacterium]